MIRQPQQFSGFALIVFGLLQRLVDQVDFVGLDLLDEGLHTRAQLLHICARVKRMRPQLCVATGETDRACWELIREMSNRVYSGQSISGRHSKPGFAKFENSTSVISSEGSFSFASCT